MIYEIAVIMVKDGSEECFEAAVEEAVSLFKRASGCLSMRLDDRRRSHGRFPTFGRLPGLAQSRCRPLRWRPRRATHRSHHFGFLGSRNDGISVPVAIVQIGRPPTPA